MAGTGTATKDGVRSIISVQGRYLAYRGLNFKGILNFFYCRDPIQSKMFCFDHKNLTLFQKMWIMLTGRLLSIKTASIVQP